MEPQKLEEHPIQTTALLKNTFFSGFSVCSGEVSGPRFSKGFGVLGMVSVFRLPGIGRPIPKVPTSEFWGSGFRV